MSAPANERHAWLTPATVLIVVAVVALAAAYVPLFLLVGSLAPRVFGFPGADIVVAFAFAAMGFLIARQYPGNPVGWIMLAVSVLLMTLGDAQLYAVLVYRAGTPGLPLGRVAAALGSTLWGPALSLLPIGVLLFPDGRIASPRWKVVLWACIAGDAAFVGAQALFALSSVMHGPVSLGIDGQLSKFSGTGLSHSTNGCGRAFLALFPLLPLSFVLAAAGLITNTLRSRGERRQQLKWFMFAAALAAAGLVLYAVSQLTFGTSAATQAASAVAMLGLAALPVGAAVAVFKYRLYEIALVISRPLVYGSLAIFITAVYVAIAVGIGALLGGGGKPNLGLSIVATAVVAVGVQPARELRSDRRGRKAEPRAVDPGHSRGCGRVPTRARTPAEGSEPTRVREARDAVRGAVA